MYNKVVYLPVWFEFDVVGKLLNRGSVGVGVEILAFFVRNLICALLVTVFARISQSHEGVTRSKWQKSPRPSLGSTILPLSFEISGCAPVQGTRTKEFHQHHIFVYWIPKYWLQTIMTTFDILNYKCLQYGQSNKVINYILRVQKTMLLTSLFLW